MKELEFLRIINETLSDTSFLGNDCAYLNDLNIYVTQDTLVEDVHFSLKTTNAYSLGIKSVAVNLSDLAANLATPKYITIGFSLPNRLDSKFVKEFYEGVDFICNQYGVSVIGGDITSSEKLFISITAIGQKTTNLKISRANAITNDLVVTTGFYGSSAAGLFALQNNLKCEKVIKEAHLLPTPRLKESGILSKLIQNHLAIMDTSDGFIDAVYKIAERSNKSIIIDFNKIPTLKEVKTFTAKQNKDITDFVFWGGEDYELLFCINKEDYIKLDKNLFKEIGLVTDRQESPVTIYKDSEKIQITKKTFEKKSFNHFKK